MGDYINTHGNMGDLCKGGDYIARDESGNLVARHDDMSCQSWVVATEPIPISITNTTDLPLSVDESTRAIYPASTSVIHVVTASSRMRRSQARSVISVTRMTSVSGAP